MSITKFEILSQLPYEEGRSFGATGPYERIEAIAHYQVNPLHYANEGIVDLKLAPRERNGLVRFQGDVTLLRPVAQHHANRALLMQVPNRGKRVLARFNQSPMGTQDTPNIPPGDGFLFEFGWTIAWAGWQWDVPRDLDRTRIGLVPPAIPAEKCQPPSQMQLRIQPNTYCDFLTLTDQHVGDLGRHTPIPIANINDPNAQLLVRDTAYGEAEVIQREKWYFKTDNTIWLDSGFKAGLIYDILYTPSVCPVAGAGLLATRELACYLRYNTEAPTASSIDCAVGEGQSQCGRFLRTYLYLGLNIDEIGQKALDGVLVHIAGGRRGEFNHRYAQPSVQPTPSFGHQFPFADNMQTDPLTGDKDGLLCKLEVHQNYPKIIYTDTSSEYWRGDAGLSHTNLETGSDADLPSNVRRYLFASTQHGPGTPTLTKKTMFGSYGQNYLNIIDYRPLYRAALINLLAWIKDETEPPESKFPRSANAEINSRTVVMSALSAFPNMALPDKAAMTSIYPLELGPNAKEGIAHMPAKFGLIPYPDLVSTIDTNGNESAGIAMPDVTVPVASHTGFNPRHSYIGGEGQLLEYIGSTLPFPKNKAEREISDDPRLSIKERYTNRNNYLELVRLAAECLVGERYILNRDVELCVNLAADRYDACINK